MNGLDQQKPRPRWVRFVVREGMRRPMAMNQVAVFALISAIGWVMACIEMDSSSMLGRIATPFGVAIGAVSALLTIWCWCAVRWVDGNGKWK